MNNKMIAGIVTYNPNIKRLVENIKSIREQVEKIVIIDNSSSNISEIEKSVDDCVIIKNKKNKGIAFALNQLMNWADKNRYNWVITLDQDSICPANYIKSATPFMKKWIGQIVPVLFESKSKMYHYLGDTPNQKNIQYVHKSITSASITNVYAWKSVGGFDNELFIDYVDYDFAMKLRLNGFKILRLNNIYLDHQIGDSCKKSIGSFSIRVSNHSPIRKYYISRNIIIYIRKYWKNINIISESLRFIKFVLITILFEKEKKEKIKKIFNGTVDGIRYKL